MSNKSNRANERAEMKINKTVKQGMVSERKNRASYYRNMAEAESLAYKRKRMERISKPLTEYAFLELRDMLNNF